MQKKYVCSKCRSKVQMEDFGARKVLCTSCNLGFYEVEFKKPPKLKSGGSKQQRKRQSEVNSVTKHDVMAVYGKWRQEKADRDADTESLEATMPPPK